VARINSDADFLDATEIRPPAAPIGTQDLDETNFVTETMENLAKALDLPKRFRPASQARDLRPCERGYWLLERGLYNDDTFKKAWGFLHNYIGNGAAGWGVWCRRDENWDWIKVYCWGSVVGHVHLVLYLATNREILHKGGNWVDADGQAVITLPIKEHR
jgi:hypothetical protein